MCIRFVQRGWEGLDLAAVESRERELMGETQDCSAPALSGVVGRRLGGVPSSRWEPLGGLGPMSSLPPLPLLPNLLPWQKEQMRLQQNSLLATVLNKYEKIFPT